MHDDRYRPRYRGRVVEDDASIRAFLDRQPWGTLTTVEDDEPVPTPLCFTYDPADHAILTHVSPAGRTASIAARGARGAFSTATMGRLVRAWKAQSFDTEYESVVAHGPVDRVEDPTERRAALDAIMAKYAPDLTPGADYRAITEGEVDRTAVVRLRVEAWSMKRNRAGPDEPTADFDPGWRTR